MSERNLLSQNLQHLRKSRKLSQSQLAEKLGLTRSKVASYENGKAEPSAQTLLRMIEYFELGLYSLIRQDLRKYDQVPMNTENGSQSLGSFDTAEMLRHLQEEAMQLRSIAEGYKAMLRLRKMSTNEKSTDRLLSDRDFETMIDLMEVALTSNEQSLSLAMTALARTPTTTALSQAERNA